MLPLLCPGFRDPDRARGSRVCWSPAVPSPARSSLVYADAPVPRFLRAPLPFPVCGQASSRLPPLLQGAVGLRPGPEPLSGATVRPCPLTTSLTVTLHCVHLFALFYLEAFLKCLLVALYISREVPNAAGGLSGAWSCPRPAGTVVPLGPKHCCHQCVLCGSCEALTGQDSPALLPSRVPVTRPCHVLQGCPWHLFSLAPRGSRCEHRAGSSALHLEPP